MGNVVEVEKQGSVAIVTLNRPQAMNAINLELAQGLAAVLAGIETDGDTRVVVLKGAGKAFMAGGDVKRFHEVAQQGDPAATRAEVDQLITAAHRAIVIMDRMPQIVVACVHGAAAGYGLSLALAADLVLAAEGTRFTLAYANIGTSPDGSSTYNLPRLVGAKKAAEIALLSDMFDAAEAERLGLINRVVPGDALAAETRKLAERLAAGPSLALARTKALLRQSLSNSLETQLQHEQRCFGESAMTADFAEGVAAFSEKRAAKFQGR